MAKAFTAETALKRVQRTTITENRTDSSPPTNRLYREYYSLDTHQPIPLEAISKRVRRRFAEIDRATTGAMLDLFFIHSNWDYYGKGESFSRYLKEVVKISRTHGYGVINAVRLLSEVYSLKGHRETDLADFIEKVSVSIEDVGITKFIVLSAMKDEEQKFDYVNRLLEGEDISVNTLQKLPAKGVKAKKRATIEGDELQFEETVILTYQTSDKALRKLVQKAVEKYYAT